MNDTPTKSELLAQACERLGLPRGRYTVKPLDRLRKYIATRLTDSARDIPHFPLTADIALDAMLDARVAYNLESSARISVNDLMVKAVALALVEVPEVNVSYMAEGMLQHHHADVAVAVAIKGGLTTPIVRAAETKAIAQIASEMRDLAMRAQGMLLKPDEYTGGSFTVSNLGMYGIASFGSIINPPQAAILSVGAARVRVVLQDGAAAEQRYMSVTLTCDHRAIDGATGARWLQALRGLIETPAPLFT
ncbi:2-oxo acid dehydrogenase subunit E2 [Hydrocarboniphaga sp.]|uniref:2-oxo acid dehydrogenase subunit E2 n=1 Tax=Hydrocarboniphaga sp. TaxID=2033016 RepID=UPI003D151447